MTDESEPSSEQSVRRFRHRTEFAREREVFRHLQPWLETYKPTKRSIFSQTDSKLSPAPEKCPDVALAAFAQLLCCHLKARRCLVTLMSSSTEYALADMTKSMSLQYDAIEDPKDKLWIGTCSFPRTEGINHEAIDEWRKARRPRESPQEQDYYYTSGLIPHCLIINDLRYSKQMQDKQFAKHGDWIRFCWSVPLRGAQGSTIGSIIVLDDKPRYGISVDELSLAEDLSDTIVEHLDHTIVRAQRSRGERFIQGLGLFNAGQSSLRDWWLSQDDARVLSSGRHANEGSTEERQTRVDAEMGPEQRPSKDVDHSPDLATAINGAFDRQDYFSSGNTRVHQASEDEEERADPQRRKHKKFANRPARNSKQSTIGNDSLAASSAAVYARASNLLREAMGADGVVFVNANKVPSMRRECFGGESDVGSRRSGTEASDSALEGVVMAELLAFSTRDKGSVGGHPIDSYEFHLPEIHFQRLLRRHAQGLVYHVDESGQAGISSDDCTTGPSSNDEISKAESHWRTKDGRIFGKVAKDARTVAFYPLWDDSLERWRSCVFAWGTSGERYFDRGENLTYLKAFGHCLQAELSRLESVAADTAKGTFISSISHELRSPLHGIMAGVEFLQDSELTAFQQEMTYTISIAGRTLLDTINHILDYAKISSFGGTENKRETSSSASRHKNLIESGTQEMGVTFNTDLAKLTEEVVETTVTAHRSQYRSALAHRTAGQPPARQHFKGSESHKAKSNGVSVTVNISRRDNWVTEMKPGGWTRIVTNLVGNALKYTSTGHISVRLEDLTKKVAEKSLVQLVVEDTGIGMSETFIAHSVFMPYKQEDPHSTGTGLGLSIVRAICKEMGATVDLTSRPNKGTRIAIRYAPKYIDANEDTARNSVRDVSPEVPRPLQVDKFHLLSLDGFPEQSPPGIDDMVGTSVLELAKEWLHCEISHGRSATRTEGSSVCAITEQELSRWNREDPDLLNSVLVEVAARHSHILVIGRSIESIYLDPKLRIHSVTTVFVHQPIGPGKLLRAIASDQDSFTQQKPPDFGPGKAATSQEENSDDLVISHTKPSNQRPGIVPWTKSDVSEPRQFSDYLQASGHSWNNMSSTAGGTSHSLPLLTSSVYSVPSHDGKSVSLLDRDANEEYDTILLVEDNAVNMKLLVALMRKLKQRYCCAVNGREALDMYRRTPGAFFLILMDMSMPTMDGFVATGKIRQTEKKRRLSRTMIVALTGLTSAESRNRAFDAGVDEYYAKPVKMKELKEIIDKIHRPD